MAESSTKSMAHLSKLESLDGNNYKRWAQKLLMFFEQLDIDYVLFNDCPTAITASADSSSPSAAALEKKYGADDAGKQKYVVGKWLSFQMVDDKPVMDQVHVYENLCADVLNEDMKICEVFQANVLLEKFPPPGGSSRPTGSKIIRTRLLVNVSKANLVESVAAPSSDKFKGKGKKPDHKAYQCPQRQGSVQKETPQANLAVSDDVIAAVWFEANLVEIVLTGFWTPGLQGISVRTRSCSMTSRMQQKVSASTWGMQQLLECLDMERFMSLSDRSICEYRDAEFFEHFSVVDEPRRSKRPRVAKDFGSDFVTAFLSESSCVDLLSDELVYAFMIEEDPKTFDEAMRSVDASFWKEAIKSELDSIVSNSTWELTDLPKGSKTIDSKWIFKKKLRPDGTIERFKARLVIRGFTQRKGLDYFDTYSPVTKIATIRTLLALAAIHDLVIHQMDVKTAFLNGDLEEEIYMSQPEGFVVLGQEDKVCKLRKSLYGLKQAPKQWYEKFDSTVVSNGFIVNNSDSCVYSKLIGSDCVIICLYVDDMLIFGNNLKVVNDTKLFLSSKFEMKDLGEADVILGVRLKRVSGRIS
ncbi:uncharacterized protein LOC130590830, partial [Beta vulgaris subsp. vulgaris]|uniref:uncharacterized protein LOC130590830 n=1 Tax=Beta vulgaris subsp. vulgaris TaxID=3555 RepID=UPI002548BAF6